MEELIPQLNEILTKNVKIRENEEDLRIELELNNEDLAPGDLGSPHEIREMITIFGGIKKKLSMDVKIDEHSSLITLGFANPEDFQLVSKVIKNLWKRASELLLKAMSVEPGKIDEFRNLGNFSNKY